MLSRKKSYESSQDPTLHEELTRKLATDLRKFVRKIEMHKAFTRPWAGMIDSVIHVANIAKMEHRHDNVSAESTLWEGDDLTVRFLLEEGKLNLCLRLMVDFKQVCPTGGMQADIFTPFVQELGMEEALIMQRAIAFEQSLGQIIRCSMMHIEAVQTTDLPMLFNYCANVLTAATTCEPEHIFQWEKPQEVFVLSYLTSVLERMDSQQAGLDENRIMPIIEGESLVPLVVKMLSMYHERLSKVVREQACAFLKIVFDSENYETPSQKAKITPTETLAMLKGFKARFLDADIASSGELKRKLRPLLDVIEKIR